MDEIKEIAEKHPLGTGVAVFAGGLLLLYLLGYLGGGSSSSSSNTSGASAFYQAEAAQTASGNQLQAVQAQAKAAVAINQQNANAYTAAQQAWANTSGLQSTNATHAAIVQSNNNVLNTQTAAGVADTQAKYAAQTAQAQANEAVSLGQQSTQLQLAQSNNNVINTYLTSALAKAQAANGQQPFLQTSSGVNVHTGTGYNGPAGVFTGQTNASSPYTASEQYVNTFGGG